jgi:hypothetical protein
MDPPMGGPEVMNDDLPAYEYPGARSLLLLHERHLRSFLEAWRLAKERGIVLPETADPAYESLEHLLRHVLSSAGGYITWTCEVLELDDPGVPPLPAVEEIEGEWEAYADAVLKCWNTPTLPTLGEKAFYVPVYPSRWNVDYCVDSMFEHAVMHPLRHEFQLRRLMGDSAGAE